MSSESDFTRPWLKNATITIYGLGLMGASLAMALRRAEIGKSIRAIDQNPETIQKGLDLNLIDVGATIPEKVLPDSDLVILAVPVQEICRILDGLGPLLKPGTIVTDLGSTKFEIVKRMDSLPDQILAIGGHPMCGRELSGIEAAQPELYIGKNYFLTLTRRTNDHSLAIMKTLVESIGAKPVVVTTSDHDQFTARTSHVPYLVSSVLFSAISDDTTTNLADIIPFVGSGLLDVTRIAGSDVNVMLDILLSNRENVLKTIVGVEKTLMHVSQLLASEQTGELENFLSQQMMIRRKLNALKV